MKKLVEEVRDFIDSNNMIRNDLATKIGISSMTLSNGLNGKFEMKFENFLNLLSEVYDSPREIRLKIKKFAMKCTSDLNLKKALFYCQVAGEYDALQYLIRKYKNNSNLKKYIDVYELFNLRNRNEARGQELIDLINNLVATKDADCKILKEMLLAVCMYDKGNYSAMLPYTENAKNALPKVTNSFIKQCMEFYFYERQAYVQLLNNNLAESRKIANKVVEANFNALITKATALCRLGESFIFSDSSGLLKAEKFILEAIDLLSEVSSTQQTRKYKAFHTTLAFLYIENGFNLNKIDFSKIDKAEIAFYEAKYGDRKIAIKLLNELLEENGSLTGFQWYYYAYARPEKRIEYLNKALLELAKNGNIYYMQAIREALTKEQVS
ncbi:AimR family lysis-lysogeny pheromone receptor [Bacillus cereus]